MDQALEKLVSQGILEAVQFSEWAAPIVPMVKRNSSIRVCGDYKLTVNQVVQVDTYPLPRIQDIFASLANGKSFMKLDLAHAYQQLLLDTDSRHTRPSTPIEDSSVTPVYPLGLLLLLRSSSTPWSRSWQVYLMFASTSTIFS